MKHFVLVHGSGHGSWCWYKLATLLRSVGHRVTALDLGDSGVNSKRLEEIGSVFEYVQPLIVLMGAIPTKERVILVGHSFGGYAVSLAMESFPEKICVAVFATAMMPTYTSPPASVNQEFFRRTPFDSVMDCHFGFDLGPQNPPTSIIFGPIYMASKMYQCCQSEDLTLATELVRPARLFIGDLSKEALLSKEKFGSVNRVFVVCEKDLLMKEDFQRWMIENNLPKEVKVIAGADHMVMLSEPQELCYYLEEIANKYV